MTRALQLLVTAALVATAGGCGGRQPDTEPATHDDFRAIQRHEARIEARRGPALDPEAECASRCEAATDVCRAGRSICRIAHDTADLDARARCRQARDACREARRRTASDCECE